MLQRIARRQRIVRRPWRLRTRMTLALVMVVAPIAALLVLSHLQNLQAQRRSQVQNIAALSDSLTASVDGFARDLESVSFAASIAVGNGNPITQQSEGPYLHNLRENYGSLSLIFVTDLNGKVLASEPSDLTDIDVSADKYVKALQTGGETVWTGVPPDTSSAPLISGTSTVGTPLMVHGRVVRNAAQQPVAYLFIAFYPTQLASRLPGDMPPDSNVSLIDDQGLVLYTTSKDSNVPQSVANSPVFAAARNGQQVHLESQASPVDSGMRYGSFERVPRTGWVVGFTRPASAIDGPFQTRLIRDVAIMTVLIIAGIVMMLLISSLLTKPLSRLSGAAAAISRGEQPVVPVDAADADMRKLERAMGTMSHAISEREERLLAQTRVMETLERVGETLATELDFEDAVASIGIAAMQLTQARSVGIYYQDADPQGGEPKLIGVAGEQFPLSTSDPLVRRTLSGEVLDVSEVGVFPGALPPQQIGSSGAVMHSFLGIPIKSRFGEVLGGLFLLHSKQNAFDERQKLLAIGLARRASIVVENARLYSQSQQTQEELRNASTAKSEFIGVMSHELRTPITTIFGGARLLRSKRNNIGQEAVDEMIVSIEEEAERLYRLVENLLTLARTDLYEHISIDILSIVRVIEQSVKQFSSRHPNRPLNALTPESLPLVLGEPGYIQLVLHNLVTNADKYSEPGRPIDIVVEKQDEEVIIKVMDRGAGVAPDEIDQIFESFYRSQRTAKLAGGK
ncbi:MAG TPA: histidine kinase dimerization/phospho-acceptor domain-containing protein, partial [Dehalococcoidia bacterium]|nr:histidine kinase dimerization/phospho-acceptor domain-containing protein [Dehalococcoidia bacterium]